MTRDLFWLQSSNSRINAALAVYGQGRAVLLLNISVK